MDRDGSRKSQCRDSTPHNTNNEWVSSCESESKRTRVTMTDKNLNEITWRGMRIEKSARFGWRLKKHRTVMGLRQQETHDIIWVTRMFEKDRTTSPRHLRDRNAYRQWKEISVSDQLEYIIKHKEISLRATWNMLRIMCKNFAEPA